MQFLEDGKLLFSGPVFDIEKSGSGNVVTYTALDLMFYVTKSDINRVSTTKPRRPSLPGYVPTWGSPSARLQPRGSPFICHGLGKKAYDGIMAAYTAASRKNRQEIHPPD